MKFAKYAAYIAFFTMSIHLMVAVQNTCADNINNTGFAAQFSGRNAFVLSDFSLMNSKLKLNYNSKPISINIGTYLYNYPFYRDSFLAFSPYATFTINSKYGKFSIGNDIETYEKSRASGASVSEDLRASFRDVAYLINAKDDHFYMTKEQLPWFSGLWSNQYGYGMYRVNLPSVQYLRSFESEDDKLTIGAGWLPTTKYNSAFIKGFYTEKTKALASMQNSQTKAQYNNNLNILISYTKYIDDLALKFVFSAERANYNGLQATFLNKALFSYTAGVNLFFAGLTGSFAIGSIRNNIFFDANDSLNLINSNYQSIGLEYQILKFHLAIGYLKANSTLNPLSIIKSTVYKKSHFNSTRIANDVKLLQISYKIAKNLQTFCTIYNTRVINFGSNKQNLGILLGLNYYAAST